MKHITKKRIGRRQILSIALAASLVLFLTLSIILTHVLEKGGEDKPPKETPQIIEGEAIKNGMALAYPEIESKPDLTFINVQNPTDEDGGEFGFFYDKDEGCHILYYMDSDGNPVSYFPDIYYQDSSFSYSSIFATETISGVPVTLVDYLCHALQTPYFEERIPFACSKLTCSLIWADGWPFISQSKYLPIQFTF